MNIPVATSMAAANKNPATRKAHPRREALCSTPPAASAEKLFLAPLFAAPPFAAPLSSLLAATVAPALIAASPLAAFRGSGAAPLAGEWSLDRWNGSAVPDAGASLVLGGGTRPPSRVEVRATAGISCGGMEGPARCPSRLTAQHSSSAGFAAPPGRVGSLATSSASASHLAGFRGAVFTPEGSFSASLTRVAANGPSGGDCGAHSLLCSHTGCWLAPGRAPPGCEALAEDGRSALTGRPGVPCPGVPCPSLVECRARPTAGRGPWPTACVPDAGRGDGDLVYCAAGLAGRVFSPDVVLAAAGLAYPPIPGHLSCPMPFSCSGRGLPVCVRG